MSQGFDYGDEVVSAGGSFKNPQVGSTVGVLKSVIHLGMFKETFNGKTKTAAPQIVLIFETKGKANRTEDGSEPLTISKQIPLRGGDKATLTKVMKAIDPDKKASGFDDLIGAACTLTLVGSEEKDDKGNPKYVNISAFSELTRDEELIEVYEAKGYLSLEVEGVGHVRFADLTDAALSELNPILDVANCLIKGENYGGSVAEQLVNARRKEDPDYAKPKSKDGDSKPESKTDEPAVPKTPPPDLDENEEF